MKYLLLAIFPLALLGCTTMTPKPLGSPQAIIEQGAYRHPRSGFVFPEAVGPFQRVQLYRYDEDGLDVSAGYDLAALGGEIAATVYVYPSPPIASSGSGAETVTAARALLAEGEFSGLKESILHSYPGAILTHSGRTYLQQRGVTYHGDVAEFAFTGMFAGMPQSLRSYLYIFMYVDRKWTIKYRFTHPASLDATDYIRSFQEALTWPF
jgi:hypothetical protein